MRTDWLRVRSSTRRGRGVNNEVGTRNQQHAPVAMERAAVHWTLDAATRVTDGRATAKTERAKAMMKGGGGGRRSRGRGVEENGGNVGEDTCNICDRGGD